MRVKPTVRYVWDYSRAKGATFVVHLTLALLADCRGIAYATQEQIAKKARLSVRTVRKAVRWLVDHGEIEVLGKSMYQVVATHLPPEEVVVWLKEKYDGECCEEQWAEDKQRAD